MRVGVLALQGDVREHAAVLDSAGASPVTVRRVGDLDGLDALVIPGGESTTILHLLATSGLREPLGAALAEGLPTLGTCAGLIVLADKVVDGRADQWSYARIDVGVRRNGYGRQVASFETDLDVRGVGAVHGVFIRAPRIEAWGEGVEVLATIDRGDGEHPVLVRQGSTWGASFHPELARDDRVHRLFLESVSH